MWCLGYIVTHVYERSFIFSIKVQKERDCRMHGIHNPVYTWPEALKVTPDRRTLEGPLGLWKSTFSGALRIGFKEILKLQRIGNRYFNIIYWTECANGFREGIASLLRRKSMRKVKCKQEIHWRAGARARWCAASFIGTRLWVGSPTIIYVHSHVNVLCMYMGIFRQENLRHFKKSESKTIVKRC